VTAGESFLALREVSKVSNVNTLERWGHYILIGIKMYKLVASLGSFTITGDD